MTARSQVGDQVRVESRGTLMGFNEFCASAQNSKKRPRQTIHMSFTGLSLKQVRGREAEGTARSVRASHVREGCAVLCCVYASVFVCASGALPNDACDRPPNDACATDHG